MMILHISHISMRQKMEKDKLYKLDTKGKPRVWWIEYDDEKYRTHSGILDGKIVTSGWIYSEEKNIGKANHTKVYEQVNLEIDAEYEKKMYQGKYHTSLEEAASGAKFVEAMLAHKFSLTKNTEYPYISQPKLDGVRCLVSKYHMQTRNGKDFVSCPHVLEELTRFFKKFPDAVLDGELYNHDLKHDFEKIVSLVRKTKPTPEDIADTQEYVQYHVYDIITPEPMSYTNRYNIISEYISGMQSIKLVHADLVNNKDEVNTLMAEYLEKGYEGQMIRIDDIPYEHKRSNSLLKNKEFDDAEFKIVNIVEGVGNWAGMAKSVEILLEDGTTQSSGMRGSFDFAKEIIENREKLLDTTVTVRYQGKTSDGKLRFPVVTHFWKGERDV
jgi:DNA ligase 1